ncbi:uncharacterized protein CC84DRAFT_1152037 [Paraphaeosphaeria sporulosa]|uniref:Zn(2)-C6 fungal-type domain-containing protein n=1 Tax=Paraphaeosphaeria sporulosa TaxID=1460663 RepID=A0A177C5E1_9PLEO|nr:uncharacterized protein CC84DRAFT_1152037 [Paraphaeosphaeria sporulosa]OAG01937.1 hypothetical protein CC84DRAFT_1152037 [Paraphaeosphaeria sporulosa]
MVGVPGRSKGCITCRKRKKGCDLKQPSCGQCEARGITCGGYDLDRMFVHAAAPSYPALVATAPHRTGRMQLGPVNMHAYNPVQLGTSLPHGLANSAYREKTLEMFFSMYLPQGDHNHRDLLIRPNNVIDLLSSTYASDEALKLAALALGTSMLGRTRGEQEWVRQGRRLYGQALRETRKALIDQQRANSDAMLLVPRVAAIFEMLFGADVNPTLQAQNWRRHAQGELAILTAQGPYRFQDGIAHHIFADARMPPLVAAIRRRKASILNAIEWKTIPWGKHPKAPRDCLIDILAGIPEVLEDIDNLRCSPNDTIARADITIKCRKLELQLQTWTTANEELLAYPDTEDPTEITFRGNARANLTLLFWTVAMYTYGALAIVLRPKMPTSSQSSLITSTDALFYARRIARSVRYFFNPLRGISGATTIAFPGGTAMLCLIHSGMERNKEYLELARGAWSSLTPSSGIQDFLNSMMLDTAAELKHGLPRLGGEFWNIEVALSRKE